MRSLAFLVVAVGLASAPSRAQPAGTLSMKESWRIEVAPGGLRAPRAVAVTGACQVWIADAEAGMWRVPCDGKAAQLVGARGRAPGEFQQPWELTVVDNDSVAVFDRALKRISVYSALGVFGRSRDVPMAEASIGQISGMAYARDAFRLWTTQYPNVADPAALHSLVLALTRAGAGHDTLRTFDGVPSIYWGSGFGGSRIPVPHQRRPCVAFMMGGGFIAGMNDAARVTVYDATGREVRQLALDRLPPQRVSNSDRDAYADSVRIATEREMAALHYNRPEQAQYRAQIDTYLKEDATFPEFRQLYDRLVVDATGETLWVLMSGSGRGYARTWNVYSTASGALQRSVQVPHAGAVVAAVVRDGALYAVEQPLNGSGRVTRYTLP
jgi:hypothetical protein